MKINENNFIVFEGMAILLPPPPFVIQLDKISLVAQKNWGVKNIILVTRDIEADKEYYRYLGAVPFWIHRDGRFTYGKDGEEIVINCVLVLNNDEKIISLCEEHMEWIEARYMTLGWHSNQNKLYSRTLPDRELAMRYDIMFDQQESMYNTTFGELPKLFGNYTLAFLDYGDDIWCELRSKYSSIFFPKELTNCDKFYPAKVVLSSQIRNTPETTLQFHISHTLILHPFDSKKTAQAYLLCDYVAVPTKTQLKLLSKLFSTYGGISKKNTCLIPAGYPKLDKLIADLAKTDSTIPDAICYAPTLSLPNEDCVDSSSLKNGKLIIQTLLNAFDYKIIFRPHPKTMKYEHVGKAYAQEIIDTFGNHPRFIYDDSNYYIDTFARSITMISDFSSSMQTFAFSTLRPFIALSSTELGALYADVYGDDDIRKKSGIVVDDLDGLVKAVETVIKESDYYKEIIREYRDSDVFNLGRSAQYIHENFDYIYKNKKNLSWYYMDGL